MKPPVSRSRRKAPAHPPRRMELLGVGKDGGLYLWQEGMVRPLDRFPMEGKWIESGHYVIDHLGKAVTVHCGNAADGRVTVQYMCGGIPTLAWHRKYIERSLLGIVVPDPEAEARILQLLRECHDALDAKQTAAHRRRWPKDLFPPGQHPTDPQSPDGQS